MNFHGFRRVSGAELAVCLFSLVVPATAQKHISYSRSELRKAMREASTADQCRTLATWFREEEATFRGKAAAEDRDYELYNRMPGPSKYPTRADTARAFRDYYFSKANQMAALADRYETQLAQPDPSYRHVTANESSADPPLSQNERMLLERIERIEQQLAPPKTP
jgi:hypothetical protein